MRSTDIAAQAVAILGSVSASGVSVAQGVATKVIGDLISEQLKRDGYAHAWNDFLKDPKNDSLVRHLIREATRQDRNFREKLEAALQAAVKEAQAKEEARGSAAQHTVTMRIEDSDAVQTDILGDVTGGKVRTKKVVKTKIDNGIKHVHIRKGHAAGVVLIALVAVVLGVKIPSMLTSPKDGGLTANSTCRQFLNADQESQRRALADIGISEGLPGYSGPLSFLTFDTECGPVPNMKIGALMKQVGNP